MPPPRAALVLRSAAHAWGLAAVDAPPLPQLSWRGSGDEVGVERHHLRLGAHDLVTRGGLRLTTPVRTCADLCRLDDPRLAQAATDEAVRRGLVSPAQIERLLVTSGDRGHGRAALVMTRAEPRCANLLESHLRLALLAAEVGPVRCQERHLGHWWDFYLPWLDTYVEGDGHAVHVAQRRVWRRDIRLAHALQLRGEGLLRFPYEVAVGPPEVVMATVRAWAVVRRPDLFPARWGT